jgi:ABC-2 type transport system permease protein
MLWYKCWMETRWRFLIGLGLMMLSAAATVLAYPQIVKLLGLAPQIDLGGEIGRRVQEQVALAREFRGYVWSQYFRLNILQIWLVFAVLLGTGGLLSQVSGGGTLFTLSLPATRNRLLGIRAATGFGELLVLAFVPSLLLPLFSPAVGQSYSISDALIHSACLFLAGGVFFSLAFLLSTIFSDVWRPIILALCVGALLALVESLIPDFSRYGLFRVISAESYFRGGALPWLGILSSAAVSVALLYSATRNIARQDF